ncbi:MAG: hypothetical protein GY724_07965 [Actinomycetia bacterium]|nr:hypothetical protein [Actinomycetes bacterium]MCP4228255.1 hypothetical protein [Actinomycetes bacterium]MCP5030694.1 hypothetical protein [Actinomycetes bacterium]
MTPVTTKGPNWRSDLGIVLPVMAGLGLAIALVFLVQALSVLRGWSTLYGSEGSFTVKECAVYPGRFSDHVECSGTFTPTDGSARTSTMAGPLGAIGSVTPRAGATVAAYHRVGITSTVYPLEGRTTELARLILGVVPLVFVVGGMGTWLVGWLLTNHITSNEAAPDPFSFTFPQRFAMRRGGATWLGVGIIWLLLDLFFVDQLLGTAGLG